MFKRILIVVDGRPVSRSAIQQGLRLAKVHEAEVTFFTVLPRYPLPAFDGPAFDLRTSQQFERSAKANADDLLATAGAMADKAKVVSRGAVGRGEDPAQSIVEAARKRRCELIVVASEGRNALLRLLTGSVIPGLITASPLPVLVCKPTERATVGGRATVVPLRPKAARRKVASAAAR